MIKLFDHQRLAVEKLRTGSILCGGVGSGKSLTALYYYYTKECGGKIDGKSISMMQKPKDLYIITTAKKRDKLEWELECIPFLISSRRTESIGGVKLVVDSWNNIKKYREIKDAFFIFDEQRVVGSGVWVSSFLKITRSNNWILLSATPGDTWMDYIAVFIANGFYRTRTEFIKRHVVYNPFVKFPKVSYYLEEERLKMLKDQIMVDMPYTRPTILHWKDIPVFYDEYLYNDVVQRRWNPIENRPIRNISDYCYTLRRIVNCHSSRFEALIDLFTRHKKIIVFYNFDYELDHLRAFKGYRGLEVAEYNGHYHQPIPDSNMWIYLVQYMSGAEGWNCIETNTVVFFSQNYSYRMMTQAAGRIDRLNTPFVNLYYYTLKSEAGIDIAIAKALKNKKDFNENQFESSHEIQ